MTNWRLSELLRSRRGGSLREQSWPDRKTCIAIKPFVHRGQQSQPADRLHARNADSLELDVTEARELQQKGLITAIPAVDRYKITFAGSGDRFWAGYRPWNMKWSSPSVDWHGRTGLDEFDNCLVRITFLGTVGAVQLLPGLTLSPGVEIYYPFGFVRSDSTGYCVEGEPARGQLFRVFLDEFADTRTERMASL
jgi:hypothetical protein